MPPNQPPPAPAGRAPLDILLVEDNRDVLDTFAIALRRRGHRVTAVSTLAAALEAAAGGRFGLLISDVGLPDGSGLDLIRLAPGAFGSAITLSGDDGDEDRRRSRESGFAEHLAKPITFARLEQAVGRAPRPEPAPGDR